VVRQKPESLGAARSGARGRALGDRGSPSRIVLTPGCGYKTRGKHARRRRHRDRGPKAGLDLLEGLAPPSWPAGSYLWAAVLADLHRRAGNATLAKQHRVIALASAPSAAVRAALERRLQSG
jgi:hypothetical protein